VSVPELANLEGEPRKKFDHFQKNRSQVFARGLHTGVIMNTVEQQGKRNKKKKETPLSWGKRESSKPEGKV